MIPYAGYELPRQRQRRSTTRHRTPLRQSYRAFMMFKAGKDTAFIAEHFQRREARILRWINEERSREKGLSNPYFE